MCCLLVSGFFTEVTQQIHSLRASGVISSHFARAAESEMRTFRKSAGTRCTAPGEIPFVAMDFILHRLFRNSSFLSSVADHPLSVASFPMNASFGPAKKPNIWTLLAIASRDASSLHIVLLSRSCGAGEFLIWPAGIGIWDLIKLTQDE